FTESFVISTLAISMPKSGVMEIQIALSENILRLTLKVALRFSVRKEIPAFALKVSKCSSELSICDSRKAVFSPSKGFLDALCPLLQEKRIKLIQIIPNVLEK